MCFKNLPIEFDAEGRAFLKAGVTDPYSYERKAISRDQLKELMARNGFIRSADFDPVTRVAGALAFHAVVDLRARRVLEANSMATLFRGYEVILKGATRATPFSSAAAPAASVAACTPPARRWPSKWPSASAHRRWPSSFGTWP